MTVSKQSLGKVCVIPKGAYDGATTYQILDLVTYGGCSYIAKQATKGNLPTNTTYWQLICSGGAGNPALKEDGILYWPAS